MADEEQAQENEAPPKKGGMVKSVLLLVVGVAIGAGGFAIPMLFPQIFGGETAEEEPTVEVKTMSSPAFIKMDEIIVNIKTESLNRYLKLVVTLQVDEDDLDDVQKEVDKKLSILRSWLLHYGSDKGMEDVRGAVGQNRMRREIQDHFNTVLFPDGNDRIQDVLFEQFNIQ